MPLNQYWLTSQPAKAVHDKGITNCCRQHQHSQDQTLLPVLEQRKADEAVSTMHQHAQLLTRLAKSQTQTRARYSWVNTVARYCAVTYSVLPVVYASHNNTPRLAMAACACTQWLMHTGVSLKLNTTMIQEKQTTPKPPHPTANTTGWLRVLSVHNSLNCLKP